MGVKNWNESRMLKKMKRVEDAQKDEMGQGSPEAKEWVKEAQNSMNTSPMVILAKGIKQRESIQ